MSISSNILKSFAEGIRLPDTRSIDLWVEENVLLPSPPYNLSGQVDLSLSPYLREPLRAISDPYIREVVIAGSPRTGKSMIHDFLALYSLLVDPGDLLLVLDTQPKAREWHETRWAKLFRTNGIDYSDERFDTKRNLILFPQLTMRFAGAKTETGLSSFPSRIVLGDEVWRWQQGMLQHARSRCLEFPHSKKIVLVSQASEQDDDFYNAWHQGTQEVWHFKCNQCGTVQPFTITGQRPDGSYYGLNFGEAKDRRSGNWDIPKASSIARYECKECRKTYTNSDADRRTLRNSGLYVTKCDNPEKGVRSFSWNAFASDNWSFGEIVKDYLLAKAEHERVPNSPAIKTFYQQVLTEFWRYSLTEDEVEPLVASESKEFDIQNEVRIATADVQEKDSEIFFTICGFNKTQKEIRLIEHGVVNSFDELHTIIRKHGVKDQRVYVDSGDQTRRVYQECAKHGHMGRGAVSNKEIWYCWNPTKGGSEKKTYFHKEKNKSEFYAPASPQSTGLSKSGQRTVHLRVFNGDIAKDILKELLDNRHEWKMYISEAAKADEIFNAHLNVEKRVPERNKRTGALQFTWKNTSQGRNDYWDSMVLQILGASIEGFL